MYRIYYASAGRTAGLVARLRRLLASPDADRGDSPVPSAVIIAGLVILALVIVGWIYFLGEDFMDNVDPNEFPDDPVAPGGGGN